MNAEEGLVFALDWPVVPGLPCICNSCGRLVFKFSALRHMNKKHPGWLERWNAAVTAAINSALTEES